MTNAEKKTLAVTACKVRMGVIEGVHGAKAGHPGGSLSAADMFTYLYFKEMKVDPKKPRWADPVSYTHLLSKCAAGRVRDLFSDKSGQAQFLRADADKAVAGIAGERGDQRVHRAAVFQVAAQAHGQMVQPPQPPPDRHQIGEGLGGVLVAAVSRVDHRDAGVERGPERRALQRMARCV